jgi:hypothetical protein
VCGAPWATLFARLGCGPDDLWAPSAGLPLDGACAGSAGVCTNRQLPGIRAVLSPPRPCTEHHPVLVCGCGVWGVGCGMWVWVCWVFVCLRMAPTPRPLPNPAQTLWTAAIFPGTSVPEFDEHGPKAGVEDAVALLLQHLNDPSHVLPEGVVSRWRSATRWSLKVRCDVMRFGVMRCAVMRGWPHNSPPLPAWATGAWCAFSGVLPAASSPVPAPSLTSACCHTRAHPPPPRRRP